MIKKQRSNQHEIYYCLNPFCSHRNNRSFNSEHSHLKSEHCTKWIIRPQQLLATELTPYALKDMQNILLDFDSAPIQALKNIEKLSISDWQKKLQLDQTKTKKQINKSIQVQFQRMREQIRTILPKAHTFKSIISLTDNPQQLSQKINDYNSHNFQIGHSYVLFKKQQLKEEINLIKISIQSAFSRLLQPTTAASSLLKPEQQRAFHEYIFQQTDQYYNKLQIIFSTLNIKPPSYHLQDQRLALKCGLCDRSLSIPINPTNKKQVKKSLAEKILYHLHSHHYLEVGFAYSRKIAKTAIQHISFQQFLNSSRNSSTVRIVDRLSGVTFQDTYQQIISNPLTFTIEIVSNQNIAMARAVYIAVSTPQAIDYLIAIICYACTQRNQNVQIITKKKQLKAGLDALLYLNLDKHQQTTQNKPNSHVSESQINVCNNLARQTLNVKIQEDE